MGEDLAEGILRGNMASLSKAITLVESKREKDRPRAWALLEELLPHTGQSLRIGISGPPGVGKSTFIEALGCLLIGRGHRVSVLAVDPTSPLGGGSIMGDKIRMEKLSREEGAFIRPSPTAQGADNSITAVTRESILLCEAAGYDIIFVETVGVGQSEYRVADMVDCFILLVLPHAGDGIQGIKRGILELAHIIVVNKADGPLEEEVQRALLVYRQGLEGIPGPREECGGPAVVASSSLDENKTALVWEKIEEFRKRAIESGYFHSNRQRQQEGWMEDIMERILWERLDRMKREDPLCLRLKSRVREGQITPLGAAKELWDHFL